MLSCIDHAHINVARVIVLFHKCYVVDILWSVDLSYLPA